MTNDAHGSPSAVSVANVPVLVDAAIVRAERSRADAAGIRPVPPERIRFVLRKPLELADKPDLLREAGALLQLYAPEESERAAVLSQKGR